MYVVSKGSPYAFVEYIDVNSNQCEMWMKFFSVDAIRMKDFRRMGECWATIIIFQFIDIYK